MKRCAVRSFVTEGGLVLLFSPLGQGRHGPGIEGIRDAIVTPNAGEVFWIERMPIDLIVFQRLRAIGVVLATWTVSPTRRRRDRRDGFAFVRVLTLCERDAAKTQHQSHGHSDRNDSISHGCPPAYFLWMIPPAGSLTFSLKKFSSMG